MPTPAGPTAAAAVTAVDVEAADDGPPRQVRLELLIDVGLLNGAAAVGAGLRQGSIVGLIDSVRRRWQAVTVPAMPGTGLSSRFLGLWAGRAFGEGSGLAFGVAAGFLQVGPRLIEFTLQALIVASEAVVVLTHLFQGGAQLL